MHTKHCFVVAPLSMAATMTTTPGLVDDAQAWRMLSNDATPLSACSATTTPCLGDNANLGDDATPLGACSVMTTPSSETLGTTPRLSATTPSLPREPYNATLGDDAMLSDNDAKLGDDDAKLGDDVTPLLMTTAMTTTMTAAVAARRQWQGRQRRGGDMQTTIN